MDVLLFETAHIFDGLEIVPKLLCQLWMIGKQTMTTSAFIGYFGNATLCKSRNTEFGCKNKRILDSSSFILFRRCFCSKVLVGGLFLVGSLDNAS